MPKIQCTTTYKGVEMTLYGYCAHFELGDYTECCLHNVFIGNTIMLADELSGKFYDERCEILSLNAELQPD